MILVGVLIVVSTLIYYPFFKMYERELLKQEKPTPAEAELNAVENR